MIYKKKKYFFDEKRVFILGVIIPSIGFYLTFSFIPIIYALYLSFHKCTMITPPEFIGIQNYFEILRDPLFYVSLRNTFIYTVVTVLIGTTLSLFLSIMIINVGELGEKYGSFFRAIYFIPSITSVVAISVVWRWLYQPDIGLFNQGLQIIGLPRLIFLQSPTQALPSLMLISIWRGLGYNALILIAGLQGIPQIFYEAAKIDGANWWQLFTKITIPLLKPAIVFVVVVGTIGSLQVFTEVLLLTRGGPLNSTRTVVFDVYQRAFSYFQMGYASAAAVILFMVIFFLSYFQLRLLRASWEY